MNTIFGYAVTGAQKYVDTVAAAVGLTKTAVAGMPGVFVAEVFATFYFANALKKQEDVNQDELRRSLLGLRRKKCGPTIGEKTMSQNNPYPN